MEADLKSPLSRAAAVALLPLDLAVRRWRR